MLVAVTSVGKARFSLVVTEMTNESQKKITTLFFLSRIKKTKKTSFSMGKIESFTVVERF